MKKTFLLQLSLIFVALFILTACRSNTATGPTLIGEDGATLVYVPEGVFTMGNDIGESDENPVHTVYLDAFWIDRNEVTNKHYAVCISGGGCTMPFDASSYTRSSYFGTAKFDEFPVIHVNWNQANAYCIWAGRKLPTEAQWEKAARGTDARIYPWGDDAPNKGFLNYNSNVGDTTKIGSYEKGKSFYGAYDMAGNVWEWVNDWYGDAYYQSSSSSNPLGPDAGQYRVMRGGSWYDDSDIVRSTVRYWFDPAISDVISGFRCARDAKP
jgi:eukaryotic-like serine/threonine-protein kinase